VNVVAVKPKSARIRGIYIGLGSNIENPSMQIKAAIKALNELPESKVLMNSGYYKSKPMGPKDQPDYINAVVEIETVWPADELLKKCQLIEQNQGRIKNRHWGERTIDLDILLYADQQIKTDELSVPHPGISSRDFVYVPLLKVNPEVQVPGKGLLKIIVGSVSEKNDDFDCQFAGNIE
jgi:2-amino-4-hydroxy-6-hydroxymethyldihydropteridine diphosphokinase